jgi:hypothetical protein
VNRWAIFAGAGILVGTLLPTLLISQTTQPSQKPGPYATIGIMRALDESHAVDLEAGYIRHLQWHRQVKDPFQWYSYSIVASTERQRWIIYATFGHTSAELSNPVSPAEDWRDATIQHTASCPIRRKHNYEFLPGLSRGNAVPSPARRPSTRQSTSSTVRERPSKRSSLLSNPSCKARRSGIAWWREEIRRATSAFGHEQVWRAF